MSTQVLNPNMSTDSINSRISHLDQNINQAPLEEIFQEQQILHTNQKLSKRSCNSQFEIPYESKSYRKLEDKENIPNVPASPRYTSKSSTFQKENELSVRSFNQLSERSNRVQSEMIPQEVDEQLFHRNALTEAKQKQQKPLQNIENQISQQKQQQQEAKEKKPKLSIILIAIIILILVIFAVVPTDQKKIQQEPKTIEITGSQFNEKQQQQQEQQQTYQQLNQLNLEVQFEKQQEQITESLQKTEEIEELQESGQESQGISSAVPASKQSTLELMAQAIMLDLEQYLRSNQKYEVTQFIGFLEEEYSTNTVNNLLELLENKIVLSKNITTSIINEKKYLVYLEV